MCQPNVDLRSAHLIKVAAAMKSGGFFDMIMRGGGELDRVKTYLEAFSEGVPTVFEEPGQGSFYPCFPGLRHRRFHDPGELKGVAKLETEFNVIRDEALQLLDGDYLSYVPRAGGLLGRLRHALGLTHSVSNWTLYLLYYMGVNLETVTLKCPHTLEVIRKLPRVCLDYPWGDALFSMHAPGTHLPAHCSIDNLRVRCHLGISIPDESQIRVGNEFRHWEEGRCLLFEDSFEHEVWNQSDSSRLVLIMDFWHPDLTDIEIRVLTAGFRKAEVRKVFFKDRIRKSSAPPAYLRHLVREIKVQDNDPLIKEFWR